MIHKRLIVVVGATGVQGGSVARTFLENPSWTVRAITRSTSSSKAKALQAKGAELFEANLNDVSSLEEAFQGAHAIFGVTDFWAVFGDPAMQSKLKPGQNMLNLSYEMEIQQGKNIFDAASRISTLERLVFSSLPNVTELSGGKITKAHHLDAKAIGAEYGRTTHPDLWLKTSIIQLGFYLTNFLDGPWTRPTKNAETETYDFSSMYCDMSLPTVAAEEDTGTLTAALVNGPAGKKLNAYREYMSVREFAQLWSRILGQKVRVLDQTFDQLPTDVQGVLKDTYKWGNDFGFLAESIDKKVTAPLGLEPAVKLPTVEAWIKAQDWSKLLQS